MIKQSYYFEAILTYTDPSRESPALPSVENPGAVLATTWISLRKFPEAKGIKIENWNYSTLDILLNMVDEKYKEVGEQAVMAMVNDALDDPTPTLNRGVNHSASKRLKHGKTQTFTPIAVPSKEICVADKLDFENITWKSAPYLLYISVKLLPSKRLWAFPAFFYR